MMACLSPYSPDLSGSTSSLISILLFYFINICIFFFSHSPFAYACKCEIEAHWQGTNQPAQPLTSGLFLAVTNKKPTQASITKVKQFEGSTSFVRRSQWMLEQLRQVNGIDPNRVSVLWSVERGWSLYTMILLLTLAVVMVVWIVFSVLVTQIGLSDLPSYGGL